MPWPDVERLAAIVQPFADFYADSKPLAVGTTALHLGGMLAGGGIAIATDRAVLRAPHVDGLAQRSILNDLAATHRVVILALVAIALSGLTFLAADLKTFAESPVYWTKMGLVALLLLNGLLLQRTERALRKASVSVTPGDALPSPLWRSLRHAATRSLLLWFTILILGVTLTAV